MKYRAYGNIAKLEIAEVDNPLRFQGQYFDAEAGLHYNRHRYYNPSTGCYLTPAPIKLAGGLSNYQYVPNPSGWVDPLGLTSVKGDCPSKGVDGAGNKLPSASNGGEPAVPSADKGYLYRGDTRSQDVIFKEGFQSKGESDDLPLHTYDNNSPPSNYVSTSTSADVAIDFGTNYRATKGYLHTIKRIPGRDVNKELGSKVPFPEEKEIAIPGQLRSEDTLGVTLLSVTAAVLVTPFQTQIDSERHGKRSLKIIRAGHSKSVIISYDAPKDQS